MLARFTRFEPLDNGRIEFETPTIVLEGELVEIENKAFHVARVRHSAGGAYSWGDLAPGEPLPPPPPPVIDEETDDEADEAEEAEPVEDAPKPAPKKRARKAAQTEEDDDGGE